MNTDASHETIYHVSAAMEALNRIVDDPDMDSMQTNHCIYEIAETLIEALAQPLFNIRQDEITYQMEDEQTNYKNHLTSVH